ncbi:aminotransferase class V-fold PLP-dependent enzyme [Pelagibius litoralis]|uniref:Aminotransferase class V-fold PLP-dependent enzyme n=1 Tax=Pelagibius litoralis TaxID=374515 RepID=A0A967F0P2_9PROT|nr:aminotransferase class V-fold PLP-dependent enzyme [Pelagibius litoralis]NIA70961.1 aminotransferase class V-fold PLP-dependent enzyme [Pelagibius litoralis]
MSSSHPDQQRWHRPVAPPDSSAFESLRQRFPGAERTTYLNVAARGLLSLDVETALQHHLEELRDGRADKDAYFAKVESVRGKFARLINAHPDEIAFTKNISDGLNIVAGAIPWQPGDNVVLCTAAEHPNNIYPWLNLRTRLGVEIRTVRDSEGAIDIEAMIAAIDERTRLVTLSQVTFSPGLRVEIEPLGRACRENGSFLLLDGAQSVGLIDSDVQRLMIDGLAVSTQKGLLGLYGLGFLYCRREWAEVMAPAALARFSVDLGEAGHHEASVGGDEYVLMPGARRFDAGNYNYPAVHAVEPSLDMLLETGIPQVEAHVTGLARKLAEGLRLLGMQVSGDPSGSDLSNIVTTGQYVRNTHDVARDPEMKELYQHLNDNGVRLTVRRGMLRFSAHIYNNEADIDRVLDLIENRSKSKLKNT